MRLDRWLSAQAARPRGVFAPLVGRWLERENREINEEALRALAPSRGEAVLEVGCGPGLTLDRIASFDVGRLAAVDASPEMIRRARSRTRRVRAFDRAGRLDVRCARAESLPFPAESFDAALSVNAIYFWRPALDGLRELRRVLRPRGRLVIAAESPDALHELGADGASGFLVPTPAELCALCETAGFEGVAVTRVGGRIADRGAYCLRGAVPDAQTA